MNNYGSVENYCRDLWNRIQRLKQLVANVPSSTGDHLRGTIDSLESVYYELVDSDLYRR